MSAPDRSVTKVLAQKVIKITQSPEQRRNWIECYNLQFQQLFLER